jgi:hypothetical protein
MSWEHGPLPNRGLCRPATVIACAACLTVFAVAGSACSSSGSGGASSESTVTDPPVIGSTTTTEATSTTPSSRGGTTTTTIDSDYSAIAKLLPTNVPSGLPLQPDRLADTGATNLAKAIQDDVSNDAGPLLRDAGFVLGYQRAWADATAIKQNTLFVYQFKTAAGAAQYAAGRAAELESENSPTARFPVLIPGAIGLHSESDQSSFGAVVFAKGVYAVVALTTDAGNLDQSATATALAAAQNLLIP